jgi:hypothetical protein
LAHGGRRSPRARRPRADRSLGIRVRTGAGIRAIAVLEEIRRRHPEITTGIRRTLERRMRTWRALVGPEQDMIFRQEHGARPRLKVYQIPCWYESPTRKHSMTKAPEAPDQKMVGE